MKKLFSLFAVVMMAVLSLNLGALSVSAAEPNTYIVKYNVAKDNWFYQVGNKWDKGATSRELYYLTLDQFKDGDYIIVDAPNGNPVLDLDFHLGNLTVKSGDSCTVNAKSIKDCYVLIGATANINCDVTNAYLYDSCVANFTKNCDNLDVTYSDASTVSVNVVGTCKSFYMHSTTKTKYNCYDFTKPLCVESGKLRNAEGEYSATPATQPAQPAPAPQAPAAGNEYDDVPKTGQSNAFLFAFGLAAVCFLGSYSLKKRA